MIIKCYFSFLFHNTIAIRPRDAEMARKTFKAASEHVK